MGNRFGLIASLLVVGLVIGCGQSQSNPAPNAGERAPSAPTPSAESAGTRPAPKVNFRKKRVTPAQDKVQPATAVTVVAPSAAANINPDAKMPKVLLTEAHGQSSLIKVGDRLPTVELRDLDGNQTPTEKLFGSRLTIVVFWSSNNPYAVEELRDLGPDVAQRYSGAGVRVIAINEQESPEQVRQVADQVKPIFPMLLDPQGTALGQVAKGHLPRTYLITPDGKVLWFDLEYSRSTRRDLQQAIQAALGGRS